jgi:hypothetical protein
MNKKYEWKHSQFQRYELDQKFEELEDAGYEIFNIMPYSTSANFTTEYLVIYRKEKNDTFSKA